MDDSVIVSPDWLAAHLDDPTVHVVDVRDAWEYDGIGHLPGAVNIPFDSYRNDSDVDRGTLPGAEAFADLLGDAGISAQVSDDEWIEIVDTIRAGIKGGHFADGLVEAVEMCGRLLHKKGVAIKPDDTDELPDDVRLRKE